MEHKPDISAGGTVAQRHTRLSDTVSVTLPRCVAEFAGRMHTKLKQNEHKGDWNGLTFDELFLRVREELEEFREAKGNPLALQWESADVANFLMMIVTNAED